MDSQPAKPARKWRLTKQTAPKGIFWSLQSGSRGDDKRYALSLGYCSEADANRALNTLQREETAHLGTRLYDGILRMYDKDRDAARDYMFGDGAFDKLKTPEEEEAPPNWAAATLNEYYSKIYEPYRKAAKPRSWYTEAASWKHILKGLGMTRIEAIDEHAVEDCLTDLKKVDGTPATWNMKRQHRNAISGMIQYARRKRYYPGPMPKWFDLEGSTERTFAVQVALTLEEVQTLMNASSPQLRAIIGAGAGL